MKFDIEKIKIKDIEGNEMQVPDLHKALANVIFNRAETVDVHTFSVELNKTGEAEISEQTAQTVAAIIGDSQMYYFVKQLIINYLNTLKCEK